MPSPIDLPITDGTYSTDNHHFSLCEAAGGGTWLAWDAYHAQGSRCFVRRFDGEAMGPILPLSDTGDMQARPVFLEAGESGVIVWMEKSGAEYSVRMRRFDGEALSPVRALAEFPPGVRIGELGADIDGEQALWVAYAKAGKGVSHVEVLRVSGGGKPLAFRLDAGAKRNYRPRLAALESGVCVAWDAYSDSTYNVYAAFLSADGPSPAQRVSSSEHWENKAALCRDAEGGVWAAWVLWRDAMWKDSVVHQDYAVRVARWDGSEWQPVHGPDGGPDVAPLRYGLLTDFARKPPALGHQGRRRHLTLKSGEDGAMWLFYEAKMDDAVQTKDSLGRLCGMRWQGGQWSAPLNVAEGRVYYELPHGSSVGAEPYIASRDIVQGRPGRAVDELRLQRVALSPLPPEVPAECRDVDMAHWRHVALPLPGLERGAGEKTCLPGPAKGQYRLIWGDFHVHGAGSVECEGELDELAHYARDKALIHALTISDNDHFWSAPVRGNERWLSDEEWEANVANAAAHNEPGRFALFPGYEQTVGTRGPRESGGRLLRNHSSVMADDDAMERDLLHFDPKVRCALAEGRRLSCRDITECVRWARERGYYPLPHAHVNWWRLVDPSVQTSCDVASAWMRNIERFDIYQRYLREGMKFGFTGSSDSHYRNPGLGGALTGLWVKELTRAGVLEALRARRTYATAGERIVLEFAVNERFMGDEAVVDSDPVLRWRVAARHGEGYVLRLLRDGIPMHEQRFEGESEGEFREAHMMEYRQGRHEYRLAVSPERPIPDYKSNAAHALGGAAWSTPVWVETADWLVR